ncbi:hypothetical protein TNCV_2270911 [Trichonephila clavipes]|nr:hypothetical protein TNCV_2270911 [Trichonephila clavipes]
MSPTGERRDEGTSELDRIRLDRKRGRRASAKQKYNESRLVDHARFNDETDNENHNDEIINDKLHELEESNLEKVDKLVKLEEKYEILQETLKITEKRLVEKEIECASLTEKILIVNALTESNDNPKTSKSTKEREINHSKRKAKKSKSSGRNANKTSHSDENQALAREKNVLLRQIDFLNSIILDTKLKEPNKSKAHFVKKRKQHIYKKDEPVTIKRTQFRTRLKLRPNFYGPYLIKTVKPMIDMKWKRLVNTKALILHLQLLIS